MIEASEAQRRLAGLVDQFADLLEAAPLEAPVPSCPEWTVERLARHLGGVHSWVTGLILGSDDGLLTRPARGSDPVTLRAWYRGSAALLLRVLVETDPAAVVTTFDDQPGPAAFWFRRQVHETAVHTWDLGTALGQDLGYDEDLALDGIDEVVTVFFPRQVRLGRIPPLGTGSRVVPDGPAQSWVLAGDGTTSAASAATELSGPADALLLALWGRVGLDDPRLNVRGDREAAASVLTAGIVP